MNPASLGDSHDVVKRFFCDVARTLGYTLYVDATYTRSLTRSQCNDFLRFVGAQPLGAETPTPPAVLLIDPDTGISGKAGPPHVSFEEIAARCDQFRLVFVLDQGFSRGSGVRREMARKLSALRDVRVRGVYFDSHTRVLICGRKPAPVMRFQKALTEAGLPPSRFAGIPASGAR